MRVRLSFAASTLFCVPFGANVDYHMATGWIDSIHGLPMPNYAAAAT